MLSIPDDIEVYICTECSDMRLGFDRLAEKIRADLKRTPIAGGLFVFFSRTRKKVRVLYWDRDGYALWMKRLEAGAYKVEQRQGYEEITGVDLREIFLGMDLSRIKFRKSAEKGCFS